jgi:putative ABC transport system permease protein
MRSLLYYWRTNLAVLFATAVCTAVLVGALVVGDSVPYSLQQIARERLGATEYAVLSNTRYFRAELAEKLSVSLGTRIAPVLNLSGIAVRSEGNLRIGGVEILGVDRRFWEIGRADVGGGRVPDPEGVPALYLALQPGQAVINQRLARRLNSAAGDEILIRLQRPQIIPAEMPFALERKTATALRVTVAAIAADEAFGRFSLNADQIAPFNLFVSLPWLSQKVDLSDKADTEARANILLVAEGSGRDSATIASELQKVWSLKDIGLTVDIPAESQEVELRSRRVFLEQALSRAAAADETFGLAAGEQPSGVFTYLVNSIVSNDGSTPYSFVTGMEQPIVPPDMGDEEIIINDWLAEDLQAAVGDALALEYYVLTPDQELAEERSIYTVRDIVSLEGPAGDRTLMPDFPGVSEVESSFDWQPGVPIDLKRIRDKDEQYWERYRGTPKAFVSLAAAQSMWTNRFGDLTAIRYPAIGQSSDRRDAIVRKILETLEPGAVGIRVVPVKQEGLQAGSGAVDFGQLFLGLSFFLLGAALLLTALLYVLGTEQRSGQTGLLLALGFSKRIIRRIRLAEGGILAAIGAAVGTILGVLYNRLLLHGLHTIWRDAVGVRSLQLRLNPPTLALGAVAGLVIALAAMWISTARQAIHSPADLQRSGRMSAPQPGRGGVRLPVLIAGILASAAAIGLVIFATVRDLNSTAVFFPAGALLLAGLLLLGARFVVLLPRAVYHPVHHTARQPRVSVFNTGFRGIARRPKRSTAVAGLLAFGIFIIFAVGANRIDLFVDAGGRKSGTGGFTLYGETTVPIPGDLNEPAERIKIGLSGQELQEANFVQMRVHEGDDASCLNLNQVESPRILGVAPQVFAQQGAFSFAKHLPLQVLQLPEGANPWLLLEQPISSDVIPAVVDQTVLTWGLHKSIGDTLSYTDEQGQDFQLKLVAGLENSVFQGSVLISEQNLVERFPSASGTRVFLADAPVPQSKQVAESISRALRDFGLEIQPTAQRLAEFNKVQNTYLSIFMLLGGLGVVLGSLGLGLVVARNVAERRGELAVLRAVGIGRGMLQRILLTEHLLLLGFGLLAGVIAAIVAVLPVVLHGGSELPYVFLGVLLSAVAINGFLWTYFSVTATTRGNLLAALRSE